MEALSIEPVLMGLEEPSSFRRIRYTKQITMIFAACSAFSAVGMTLVWPNILASHIKEDNSTLFNTEIHLSDWQMDTLASVMFMGSMPGFVLSGWLVGRIGRRWAMLASSIPNIIGAVLIACSYNTYMLIAGRFFDGISFGMVGVAIRTYIVEVSDIKIRGSAVILVNIFMQLGSISILCIGLVVTWYQTVFISGFIMVLYCLLIVPNLPESPTYLAVNDRDSEALEVLSQLRGPYADIKEELAHLKKMNKCNGEKLGYKDLLKKEILTKMIIVFVLFAICNFSGVQVLKTNTTRMVQASGIELDKSISTIMVTSLLFLGNFSMMLLVDKLGRCCCLIISFMLLALSYGSLGIYTLITDSDTMSTDIEVITLSSGDSNSTIIYDEFSSTGEGMNWSWIPLVCLMGAALGQSSGAGPIPFLLAPEYFPTNIRSQGTGICTMMGGLMSFTVLQLYSPIQNALTQTGLFWTFAISAAIGIPYTIFFVQETSGKRVG